MNWLTNPWIVSLLTAIASTVIVNFLSNFLGKKDYIRRVDKANKELIIALKNIISEGEIPSKPLLESLSSAYSKSNNIKKNSMNSVSEILDHLIKEIFETNFLSIDQKSDIANKLLAMKEDSIIHSIETRDGKVDVRIVDKSEQKLKELQKIKQSFATVVLLYLSILMIYLLMSEFTNVIDYLQNNQLIEISLVVLAALIIIVLLISMFLLNFKGGSLFRKMKK
ncbi:hypothetical protein C2H96_01700 [Bacillus subtilis]|uniref:hypothetical protein n=2 Tax=Bacillus subtilis TaxID=1423 RepID=UPI00201CB440|nr:hypothetical protein [Bacillus subtilis]UQZ53293.1 hypothetical protein C2H96_01700 [Bacillus subtilis]UQZ68328.1 hypothetical protein C2H97_18565 [Bacillus subtilis PY79]UQZ72735.1 hypothetical protein C2I05_20530 [Bacillus subtilis]